MDDLAREFDAYVRARTPALLRSAYLLTGDQQHAEDLVQSALIRTHRAWRRLYPKGHPDAYTRAVMYHLQVAWWRRGRVAESLVAEVPEAQPTDQSAGDHEITTRLVLRAALMKLTARQRAVLVLRYFEDRTEAETADVLGVTVGTVKSQTAKAMGRLRTLAQELAEFVRPEGTHR